MRRNLVVFVLVILVVVVLFFFLVFRPQSTRIGEARDRADQEEQRVESLRVELARLKALEQRAPELREQAAKLDTSLPSDPRLAEFILQMQEAANVSGIEWLSVSPTPPAAGAVPGVSVVAISMSVNGGYFQVQDFLVRIETLPRAMKVLSLSLGPGAGFPPELSVSLSMQMFVSVPVAPAA